MPSLVTLSQRLTQALVFPVFSISNIECDLFTVISQAFQPTPAYYVILKKVKAPKKQPV